LIGGFLIAGKALGVDEIRGASRRYDTEETLGRGKSRRRPLDKGELRIGSYGAREGEEGEGAPIAERVRTGRYLA
jgi:hypothetical protein